MIFASILGYVSRTTSRTTIVYNRIVQSWLNMWRSKTNVVIHLVWWTRNFCLFLLNLNVLSIWLLVAVWSCRRSVVSNSRTRNLRRVHRTLERHFVRLVINFNLGRNLLVHIKLIMVHLLHLSIHIRRPLFASNGYKLVNIWLLLLHCHMFEVLGVLAIYRHILRWVYQTFTIEHQRLVVIKWLCRVKHGFWLNDFAMDD